MAFCENYCFPVVTPPVPEKCFRAGLRVFGLGFGGQGEKVAGRGVSVAKNGVLGVVGPEEGLQAY